MRSKDRFSLIKGEWRNLFKNRILFISCLVLGFIPVLYGGFFLGGIWDPYGRTSDIPIAVVNQDTPATVDGRVLNIGQDVVTQLKSNHDLKWEFVSADTATQGLDSGHYYMVITLPSDFSKNAASVTSDTPSKSRLLYTLTPSKNYVGSLISNQAAEKLIGNVKEQVTKQYVSALLSHLSELKSGMKDAAQGASELSNGAHALASGVSTYTNGVSRLSAGTQQIAIGTQQLTSGSSALSTGLTQLTTQLPSAAEITQLTDGVAAIQTGLQQLNDSASTADTSAQAAVQTDSATVINDLITYKTLMTSGQTSLYNLSTATAAATAGAQPTLTVSTSDVAAALQAVTAASALATHTQTLLQDLQTMEAALTTQQKQLITSVGALNSGMNSLAPNTITALKGYSTIGAATQQLSSGASSLTSGLTTAHTGMLSLYSGTRELTSGSASLTKGATLVADGTSTLTDKLAHAADQLALQPTGDATANHIATPIAAEVSNKGDVPNYGFALSPYVLVLGLYVGALTFTVVYPVRSKFGQARSAIGWFFSKWSVSMLVGLGQAVILSIGMIGILGLRPVDPLGFAVVLAASSFTYMAIANMLAILFDNPGRFAAMLLLVAQLGAAEGTFPIITSAPFFQAINPWLPMTYAIQGMRVAISGDVGGQTIVGNTLAVLAFGLIANGILYIFLAIRHYKPFKHDSVTVDA